MSSNIASIEMHFAFAWNRCWIHHGPSYPVFCVPPLILQCTYLSMLPIFSLALSGWVSQLHLLANYSPLIYIKIPTFKFFFNIQLF